MNKVILALTLVLYFALPVRPHAQISRAENNRIESHSNSNVNNLDHSYKLVFQNGMWWIYEYDEDGGLVNIYPADE